MGEVASVIKALSCDACAKHLCNGLSMHSRCCDDQEGCVCDTTTEPTRLETVDEEVEIEMDGCNDLCCSCLLRAHK